MYNLHRYVNVPQGLILSYQHDNTEPETGE